MGLRKFCFLILLCFVVGNVRSQEVGIKTNALYWLTTTPNFGVEYRFANHLTFSVNLGYNAFKFSGSTVDGVSSNPKIHHWLVRPAVKYWFCRPYERSFLGVHLLYGDYNAGGIKPIRFMRHTRYKGYGAGGGVSYGYQWAWGKRWGIEASFGAGYLYLRYDKYKCGSCGEKQGRYSRHYIGPTEAALSLIYYIR